MPRRSSPSALRKRCCESASYRGLWILTSSRNGRHALQVHASLYRDLLTLLQREALLALTVRALAIVCDEPRPSGQSQTAPDAAAGRHIVPQEVPRVALKAAGMERGRCTRFSARPADLPRIAGAWRAAKRTRKPFEAADHPFVDRCAFLLDSSFMENARLAASRTLTGIEELAAQLTARPDEETRTKSSQTS